MVKATFALAAIPARTAHAKAVTKDFIVVDVCDLTTVEGSWWQRREESVRLPGVTGVLEVKQRRGLKKVKQQLNSGSLVDMT